MKTFSICLSLSLFLSAIAFAQESAESEDQAAVRATIEKYVDSFNTGDVDALISVWAEDGDYVDQYGRMIQGKESIANEYRKYFAVVKNPTISIRVLSLRMLGDSVATEDGIREANIGPSGDPLRVRYTAIHVKKDGKWMVQSVRDAIASEPTNYHHLRDLEWMVGDWIDTEEDGTLIHSSCDWSKGRNFLIRNLTSAHQGKVTMSATQWIGWDAVNGKVNSWEFDSNGSVGTGTWTHDGTKWVIDSTTSLPSGQVVKETHMISQGDNDTMIFESKERSIDGQELPDIREVTSIRDEAKSE